MRRILVPTDFSEQASNALDYAIQLSNAYKGHIDLVHFYTTIRKTGQLKSMEPILRREAEDSMAELASQYVPKLTDGATLSTHIYQGYPAAMLAKLSAQEETDFVIMGTQGASGAIDVFLGSTASAVVSKTSAPTLIIPGNAKFSTIKSILFALDDRNLPESVLNPLKGICEKFNAHVHLLNVGEETLGSPTLEIENRFENCICSMTSKVGDDVIEEIGQYAKEIDADVIVMVRHSKNLFEKIFKGSHTKREIFNTEVPLLILHD